MAEPLDLNTFEQIAIRSGPKTMPSPHTPTLVLLSFIIAATPAVAQTDSIVKTVVSATESNYNQTHGIKGRFSISTERPGGTPGIQKRKLPDGTIITFERAPHRVMHYTFILLADKARSELLDSSGQCIERWTRDRDRLLQFQPSTDTNTAWIMNKDKLPGVSIFDPRQLGIPDRRWMTWRDFIYGNLVTKATMVTTEAPNHVTIEVTSQHKETTTIRFDQATDYMPDHVVNYRRDGSIYSATTINYSRLNDNTWFPKQAIQRRYRPKETSNPDSQNWVERDTLEVQECTLDPAVTDSTFAFNVPDYTIVRDNIAKKIYRVGDRFVEEGRPNEFRMSEWLMRPALYTLLAIVLIIAAVLGWHYWKKGKSRA